MFLGDYLNEIEYMIEHAFNGNKYSCCFNEIEPTFDCWNFYTDTAMYYLLKDGTIIKQTGSWKNATRELVYKGVN